MNPNQDHENRISRLEQITLDHESRMKFLEGLMDRVVSLNEVVIELLQRQQEGNAGNGV